MENIISLLDSILNNEKNSAKHDVVCALGGAVSLLQNRINKIIETPIVELRTGQKFKLIELDTRFHLVNKTWLVFKRYCYIKNEYHFTSVGEESKEGSAIEFDKHADVIYGSKNFPQHKDYPREHNFEFHPVDNF